MKHRAIVTAILLVALTFAFTAAPSLADTPKLEIHYINVQQGGATLVIGPDGTTVLLDAGANGKGTSEIVPYLENEVGILPAAGLDYVIAGHTDADHIGGYSEIFGADDADYEVNQGNWFNGDVRTSQTYGRYWGAALATGHTPTAPLPGDEIPLGNTALLTVVACDGHLIDGSDETVSDHNDRSIAVLVEYLQFQFLWASDLGGGDDDDHCFARSTGQANVEQPLAEALTTEPDALLGDLGVDVLHVNHHGSASSTNIWWMNLLRPEVAVISVGRNRWDHPVPIVVEEVLMARNACIDEGVWPALVLQTEEGELSRGASSAGYSVGDVVITTDGVAYDVEVTGEVSQGPNEGAAVGLPRFGLPVDDQAAGCPVYVDLTETIAAVETIEALHMIVAGSGAQVAPTGELSLVAGALVALHNDFSVASGGRLSIGIDPTADCL